MNVDVTPEPEDIVQNEAPYGGVPIDVKVCNPVQTREVPAAGHPGYFTAQAIGAAVGVRLLALEPRRKYATIIAQSQDVWISSSQAGAQAGAGGAMRIPAVVPYVIGHMHEVWVCSVTGTTDVSVETVNWSE
jgi:hypothetical protein